MVLPRGFRVPRGSDSRVGVILRGEWGVRGVQVQEFVWVPENQESLAWAERVGRESRARQQSLQAPSAASAQAESV